MSADLRFFKFPAFIYWDLFNSEVTIHFYSDETCASSHKNIENTKNFSRRGQKIVDSVVVQF